MKIEKIFLYCQKLKYEKFQMGFPWYELLCAFDKIVEQNIMLIIYEKV